jgi:iron complex outermembrane receptor protein
MRIGRTTVGAKHLLFTLVSMLPLLAPAVSQAQPGAAQASPPGAQLAQNDADTGQVIVTAEKRAQRLIDVPASVSVITAKDVQTRHLIALSDVAQQVPNVLISGSSLFPNIEIRGVGSASGGNPGFAPAATVYVDEVYQGRERAENLPLCGIDQVEVLRGPQSTLYGKNTIAGAININTLAPTRDFHATADGQAGNLDFGQFCGTVSGPVATDNLRISLNGLYRHRDGDIYNAFDGKRLNYDDAGALRARAIYEATPHLTFDLSADYLNERDSESDLTTDYSSFQLLGPPYSTSPTYNPRTRTEALNAPEYGRRQVGGVSARINYDLPHAKLTSISAYRDYGSQYAYDSDGSRLNEDAQNNTDDANQFSQELRLTSVDPGPLQWIVGGYYYHENLHDTFTTHFLDQFPSLLLGLPPLPVGYDDETLAKANIIENSYAGFASVNYSFTPRLVLTAGVRYTQDDKTLHFSQLQTSTNPPGSLSIGSLLLAHIPPRTDSIAEGVPTYDASLSFKFTPDAVGYIKYSRGYKAGGFNAYVITPPYNPNLSLGFKPEFLDNYEAGFKSTWFDHRLSVDIAAFYDNYTNKQEIVENIAVLGFTVENAAKARIYGAEIEADARPLPGLDLSANIGLLNGTYLSFPDAGAGLNFTGHKLAGAPDWDGTFAAQYEHELDFRPGVSGMARIEVFHSDAFFEDPNNTPGFETKPYSYLNARLGVEADDGQWGFYLWGKNLTDTFVLSGGYVSLPLTARAVNFPRLFGLELVLKH